MKVAKKSNVVVDICNIRVIGKAALCENKGHAESDALARSWSQPSFGSSARIRFREPLFPVVGVLTQDKKLSFGFGD